MQATIPLAESFLLVAAFFQFASIGLVGMRSWRRHAKSGTDTKPPITILRPVCGIENNIEETLSSGLRLAYPNYETIFCVASGSDPIIPVLQRLIDAHPHADARMLIGDDPISKNPKLNNLVKGWATTSHDWIVMADSNVLMPSDYIEKLLSVWSPGTGLVCSPPAGVAPEGIWAELECGFLNTFQARWQLAADSVGLGFAQGKTMLWHRDIVEAAGGIGTLASELAEDAAATKVARLRRASFKLFFLPEILAGGVLPLAAAVYLSAAGALPVAGVFAIAIG
jgi:ceramide glucosyltransferase